MRTSKMFVSGVAALLLLGSFPALVAQDPAVVNASTIKVRIDNNKVRVFDAMLKPGDKEKLHSHPAYVFYVIDGGKIRNHAADGKTTDVELKAGDVAFRDPLTHWAENIGDTTVHVLLVEVKNPS
ncbi:MAG TPA: cupin domain-containing protein [Thermoanaerobaculia bacterium]